jgi:hypothetical protein
MRNLPIQPNVFERYQQKMANSTNGEVTVEPTKQNAACCSQTYNDRQICSQIIEEPKT